MITKIKTKYKAHKLQSAQKKEERQQLRSAILNAPSAFDQAVISWEAPEYVAYKKGPVWKITMVLLVAIIAILSLYYNAWSLALVVVVFAIVYKLVNLEHPRNMEIKISEIGIKVGLRKYSYGKIKAFWLIYEPPFVQTLNLRVDGEWIGDITIQLGDQDPAQVREYLISKIPEMEGKMESFSDIFVRLFKI
ncbi:MAG: hypothetical protein PHP74_00330 [Candidatus Gracilibacteria bacterium]|nr:hypothetical protein [Candidatus Gracilibacteria bacterium]